MNVFFEYSWSYRLRNRLPVWSPPWSRGPRCINYRGLPSVECTGELTTLVYKKNAKYIREWRPPPPVTYTLGSFNSCVFLSPESFFCKPVLILLPNIAKSRLQVYSPQGSWDSPDIFTTGKCRLPGIFTTGSQTPQYIHLRGVILDTEGSFYQF